MQKEKYDEMGNSDSQFFPACETGQPVISGLFLVFLGTILFLGATGVTILGHSAWWLVGLLPAVYLGMMAYNLYQRDGRVSSRVAIMLIWGMIPLLFVAGNILGFNIGALWPLALIATGVTLLFSGSRR